MPTKKKNTKKYDLSRSDIVDRISEIIDNLQGIDTVMESPDAVSMTIGDAVSDLESLQDQVTEEAF